MPPRKVPPKVLNVTPTEEPKVKVKPKEEAEIRSPKEHKEQKPKGTTFSLFGWGI